MSFGSPNISTWQQFTKRVRYSGKPMLKRLDDFPRSILVAGCQRSGTTALTRLITQCDDIVDFRFSRDEELDGALILAAEIDHSPRGRYCFQTTYLNERVHEYLEHGRDHKIIWVLRNPYSVVYSILHNWRDFALNELFLGCGRQLLSEGENTWFERLGLLTIRRLKRACYAYTGKTRQIFDLYRQLGPQNVLLLDYDELVTKKEIMLPKVFSFVDLRYSSRYGEQLHNKSINKKQKISRREKAAVDQICLPVYEQAMQSLREQHTRLDMRTDFLADHHLKLIGKL